MCSQSMTRKISCNYSHCSKKQADQKKMSALFFFVGSLNVRICCFSLSFLSIHEEYLDFLAVEEMRQIEEVTLVMKNVMHLCAFSAFFLTIVKIIIMVKRIMK